MTQEEKRKMLESHKRWPEYNGGFDLRGVDLRGVDLRGADLQGVRLQWATGNGKQVKSFHIYPYHIVYTSTTMAIGCEQHHIDAWFAFSDKEIAEMARGALVWWQAHGPRIRQIIETAPAEETIREAAFGSTGQ